MKTLFVVIALLFVSGQPLVAADSPSSRPPARSTLEVTDLVKQVRSADKRDRDEAVRSIRADRTKMLYELQRIIVQYRADPTKQENVKTAMILLGELGAKDAVPTLVDNLTFTMPAPIGASGPTLHPLQRFPQLQALVEIGLPSLDPLVKKVGVFRGHEPIMDV
jgi:hypothetical protein